MLACASASSGYWYAGALNPAAQSVSSSPAPAPIFVWKYSHGGDMGGIIVVDFIDLNSNSNRKKLFEHLCQEMSTDRTKHKILPPSRFGLIQITRQRVRPEMNIKTQEPNPNVNGEVEAPIVLIDKINTELSNITKIPRIQKEKLFLHVHPFVAAYLLNGTPSQRLKWYFEYKKWIRIVPRHAYQYLEF